MSEHCHCAGPGHCPTFKRTMNLREYQLCSETCPGGCPAAPNDPASYRQLWAAQPPEPDAQGRVVYGGCGQATPLPWWKRIWHFAKAIFVHTSADGLQHVPEKVFRERLTKCKTSGRGTAVNGTWTAQPCPHYWERPKGDPPPRWPRLRRLLMWLGIQEEDLDRGCHKCACSGLKLRWPSQKCPIGKWDTYPPSLSEATKTSGG